jgi:hypothetical protein
MAWPRTKKPTSSTLPAAREHEGVHVTAAPDAEPAPDTGQNTGVSGTLHTVVEGGQTPKAQVNDEIASPAAAGTGVIEGTVITGTPADALTAASSADPHPVGSGPEQSHGAETARQADAARQADTGGSYDETSGIVYEVTPDRGFAAVGLHPDAESAAPSVTPRPVGDTAPGAPPAPAPGSAPSSAAGSGTAEAPATPTIVISGLTQARAASTASTTDSAAQPTWNQTTASVHGAEEEKKSGLLGTFGGMFGRSGSAGDPGEDDPDRPPLTRVRDLPLDQKLRIWRIRALIVVVVGIVFTIIADWEVGVTLAIVAGIADTVYRARTVEAHHWTQPGTVDRATWRAQKRTQKQLAGMHRAGYVALNRRPIPDSVEVIDHLLVGPTGVYAIDSEKWDKDMPIRARNNKTLFHGPQNMKERLEHAKWEAGQASELLSEALGTEIKVLPALAIYGPKIPWDILHVRDVDVLSGDRLKKYLRRRGHDKRVKRLSAADVNKIQAAASVVLPLATGKAATPVG